MPNLITIQNVRGFIDENGTAQLNLEDVSRGLGFTYIKKNGNVQYVRQQRVLYYLKSFNFATSGEFSEMFIPENIFYLLAMKANNETALKFQMKVANEILPSIRKTGTYSVQPQNALQALQQTVAVLTEHETRIEKLENTMTIDYTQQEAIRELANKTVIDALGGKKSNAYKILKNHAFAEFWRGYKRAFMVNSYKNTPTVEFEKAKEFSERWKPSRELELMIIGANVA